MLIKPIDFDDPRVQALLELHVQAMRRSSPPETVFVLERAALDVPEIEFFAAWDGDALLGFGALKALLDDVNVEDKGCTERVFRGLSSEMAKPGHLSHLERPNYDFATYLSRMTNG